MSISFQNAHNQNVVFTHQDQDLVEAFHKVKRFLIKDVKNLRGLVINVRGTSGLSNCFIQPLRLDGKPEVKKGQFVEPGTMVFKNSIAYAEGFSSGYIESETYVSVLIGYHITFKYNTKVKTFLEKLKQADRFQQHCVINSVEYTLENFNLYKADVFLDMTIHSWIMERD